MRHDRSSIQKLGVGGRVETRYQPKKDPVRWKWYEHGKIEIDDKELGCFLLGSLIAADSINFATEN